MAKTFPTPKKWTPKNPGKYIGDASNIIMRSSWETKFAIWADLNPAVIKWGSEEIAIPYFSMVDLKTHRYFPDFVMMVKDRNGTIKRYCVEIKPSAQTLPPKKSSRMSKKYITEMATYAVNSAKWAAAETWCNNNNITFIILDEYALGIVPKKRNT
jgi:dTDP-D-glucose 4,6-dehydratase